VKIVQHREIKVIQNKHEMKGLVVVHQPLILLPQLELHLVVHLLIHPIQLAKIPVKEKKFFDQPFFIRLDQSRTTGTARVKKIAAVVSATSKKNISIVKEEDENKSGEVKNFFKFSFFFLLINHKITCTSILQEALNCLSILFDFVVSRNDLMLYINILPILAFIYYSFI
jgi:hypothetical protein